MCVSQKLSEAHFGHLYNENHSTYLIELLWVLSNADIISIWSASLNAQHME